MTGTIGFYGYAGDTIIMHSEIMAVFSDSKHVDDLIRDGCPQQHLYANELHTIHRDWNLDYSVRPHPQGG